MNTQQTITAAAGAALVGVNFWTGPQRHAISAGALSSSASSSEQETAHKAVVQLAAELLFVGVAVLLAGASRAAGSAMVAVFVALGLLWLIKHYSTPAKKGK